MRKNIKVNNKTVTTNKTIYVLLFKNIITGILFINKKDNQKLKHGGEEMK